VPLRFLLILFHVMPSMSPTLKEMVTAVLISVDVFFKIHCAPLLTIYRLAYTSIGSNKLSWAPQ
jgi:hypothetical protein